MSQQLRLSAGERDELEALMELRDPSFSGPMRASVTRVHGFLTSIISASTAMPSDWLPIIFNDADDESRWQTTDQAQRAMTLAMRFYDDVASALARGRFRIMVDRIGEEPHAFDVADDWCRGYLFGLGFNDEWDEAMEDPDVSTWLLPIVGLADLEEQHFFHPEKNPEEYRGLLTAVTYCALNIHEWWQNRRMSSTAPVPQVTVRRSVPKISPNAPCPCGSGKKHKRCCGAVHAL